VTVPPDHDAAAPPRRGHQLLPGGIRTLPAGEPGAL